MLRNESVFILAEVAQSYEGNIKILDELAKKTCRSGADGIMFQVVFADELAVNNYIHYDLFESLEMPKDNWKMVIETIHNENKMAIGEIFGKRSIDIILDLGIDALKIHASDLTNLPLLKYIGSLKLPVFLSVGGAYETEIQKAIKALKDNGTQELILMHGFQACPTDIKDSHLGKIQALRDRYDLPIGYSDHIAGCIEGDVGRVNELAYYLPIAALGAGAKVIEKHVMLDRTKSWEDHESALIPDEFKTFVDLVRKLETSLGNNTIELSKPEKTYRKNVRKSIVASKQIDKNIMITEEMISFKRISNPDQGFVNIDDVIGKMTTNYVDKDMPIKTSCINKM